MNQEKYILISGKCGENVEKNSPAEKAGLQKDDQILSINYMDVKELSINEINKLLMNKEGKRIKMIIKRGMKEIKAEFKLEKRI